MTSATSQAVSSSSFQLAVRERSPRRPSASSPPAIEIISGTQWPAMNGGSSHSSASTRGRGAPSTAADTASSRRRACSRSRRASRSALAASPRRAKSRDHVVELHRVERQHARLAGQRRGDRNDVVVRDRADVADRLRDDQVGLELGEPLGVELVERPPAVHCLADRAVDLRCRESVGDHGAGEVGDGRRLGRPVALVRHGDHLVAEAEREQQLGRARDERRDPHRTEV